MTHHSHYYCLLLLKKLSLNDGALGEEVPTQSYNCNCNFNSKNQSSHFETEHQQRGDIKPRRPPSSSSLPLSQLYTASSQQTVSSYSRHSVSQLDLARGVMATTSKSLCVHACTVVCFSWRCGDGRVAICNSSSFRLTNLGRDIVPVVSQSRSGLTQLRSWGSSRIVEDCKMLCALH